jgi:hypothetical protein
MAEANHQSKQRRSTVRLAWGLWALGSFMMLGAIVLAFLVRGYAEAPGAMPLLQRQLLFLPGILAYQTVGALIAARQPRNPVGWLFLASSLVAWLGGLAESYWRYALLVRPGELPGGMLMLLINTRPYVLGAIFDTLLILLFPTGRPLAPRWWFAGALALFGASLTIVAIVLMPGTLDPTIQIANPIGIAGAEEILRRLYDVGTTLQLIGTLAITLSLVLRLRRAQGVERQQVKLLVLALVVYMAAQGVVILAVARSWEGLTGTSDLGFALQAGASVLVATAAGVAILRHHLFDIDIIIRRTLVYSLLTVLLGGFYVSSVVALQALFIRLFEHESTLAVVIATLLAAALFRPLRAVVQRMIDRRFFRTRYDTRLVLKDFAARAQQNTNLDATAADLLATLDASLKPERARLWLVRTQEGRR